MTRLGLVALFLPGQVDAGDTVLDAARALVSQGPRVAGTEGGRAAQAWVAEELREAGYEPAVLASESGRGAVLACQGAPDGAAWVVAHTDAVHADCPGAVDNAGAVAVALSLARDLREERLPSPLCFAFPDGEERGLWGSASLAERFQPAWVVSLELVGQGQPTAMGLGPGWGTAGLRWLAEEGDLAIPWAYRVHSRLLPGQERSDHAPFARNGVPALLVLGRPRSGIYWPYHTARDTLERLDPEALAAAESSVEGLLRSGRPTDREDAALQLPYTRWTLPGPLVWLVLATGSLLGLSRARGAHRGLGWGLAAAGAATLAGGAAWWLALHGRPGEGALAGPGLLAWAATAVAACAWLPVRPGAVRGGAVGLGLATGVLAWLDPLLALPFGLAAGGLAWMDRQPLAALLTLPLPLYLTCPSSWRELVFHGVIPASPLVWLPVLALLWWAPVCAWLGTRWRPRRPWLAGLVAGVVIAWAAVAPTWTETWFTRSELLPW